MKRIPLIKNFVTLIIALVTIKAKTSAQLTVTPNVYITSSGNTEIVLHGIDLINNGTFNHSAGNVQVTGNGITSLAGNGLLSFYNLKMNKSAGYLLLSRNIAIKNELQFMAGNLNLNGFNIDLLTTGKLINEKEVSRITGSNGGTVKTIINLNAPNGVNPGNLGAVITSTENLGSVLIERGHQPQLNDLGTGNSILRYFEVTPTNNAGLKATLHFKYFDAELNAIPETDLVLFKGSANGSWVEKGYTTRDATFNYVEKINNPDFSRWTLSNTGNVLASGCPDGMPTQNYYADADGDGYGNPNNMVSACTQPAGYVLNKKDCNDNNAAINPGATEICNGMDDDCDGQIDEDVQTVYYPDVDGDGYGNMAAFITSCSPPKGYILTAGDCDDNNAAIYPGAVEICGNLIDDNCNGQVDEDCNTITPSLAINNITIMESQGTAHLTVTLTAPAASAVTVKYKTINGTAVHPKDFIRVSGDLVFAPGEITKTIPVQIKSDNQPEPIEWFEVVLNSPVNATISNGTGRVTITEEIMTIARPGELLEKEEYFNVMVRRNPTADYFEIQVLGMNNQRFKLSVTDVLGRLVESLESGTSAIVQIGYNYSPGIYFIEVQQGNNRKMLKLVKQ